MTGDHLYVYGIVEDEELELDVEGVGGAERIYTVTTGGLSAVVSDIDTTDPERTTEAMEAHDRVLKAILEDRTVVPMSFGMAFKDERTLRNVLGGGKRAFRKALDEVEGTVELGVKLVGDADADLRRDPAREEARDRLEPIAVDVVGNDLFSDRLLVNDSYLVDRDDRVAFDEAVGALEQDLDGVVVQYTGPFAPYNFVDIRIGAEQ
ncbi:GvpL/GvpF family gas vesicle protein [Natronoarchaeum rubrum]|uniref:GvpL/GvpF family gas vesicle protein n=1 Tax=Natronoarchaeum rubrum TaxID=755311 RepID=UPI002111345E|nr:GvpL/GvpF family gas vesicle protein [Natronoarchaeum rubrum]